MIWRNDSWFSESNRSKTKSRAGPARPLGLLEQIKGKKRKKCEEAGGGKERKEYSEHHSELCNTCYNCRDRCIFSTLR